LCGLVVPHCSSLLVTPTVRPSRLLILGSYTPHLCVALVWQSYFALYVELTMVYDTIPLIIPVLATGYVLTIYVLLKLAERSQA
jgi:hypothetical protein